MARPKSHRRRDYKVSACLTQDGADALEAIMAENPYQSKSNVIDKAIVLMHTMGRHGFNANLDPLPEPRMRITKGGRR